MISVHFIRFMHVATLMILLFSCGGGQNTNNTKDTVAPFIVLDGNEVVAVPLGRTYSDPGARASDAIDDVIEVTVSGDLDVMKLGTYTLTYTATDKANNSASLTRQVTVVPADGFTSVWKTDNPGDSLDNQITIYTLGDGYDYSISWGDGQSDTGVTGEIRHTYSEPGTYVVTIYGDFPRINFGSFYDETLGKYEARDSEKLLAVEHWGDIKLRTMEFAFFRCYNFTLNTNLTPDLSQVTNLRLAFTDTKMNADISGWDVSSITDMSYLFSGTPFNHDISDWDVSSVTDMSHMFYGTPFNHDINGWDVSSVADMSYMFFQAKYFNKPLADWDVSSVVTMWSMFNSASAFNQDISSWDVSSVVRFWSTFRDANAFNQDISSWDVSSATNMESMFNGAEKFNQPLNDWDVSHVEFMGFMFAGATVFNQPLDLWQTSKVSNMEVMFYHANAFDQNLGGWDVSAVLNMASMLDESGLSTAKYDALLQGWSTLELQRDVYFSAIGIQYSSSVQTARDLLKSEFNWTVQDSGLAE
ncbi:MAG: BspA family leucine-rich repeat surface protein [Paraglaciecola sp.]|uniref:BspA family leucine-rich repeat surface protein n=1 Tax=Paraglaciecola sp. TaxID=1920173 RepID=UPI003296DF24